MPKNTQRDCRDPMTHHTQVTQLLVRLGLKPDLVNFLNEDSSIPGCFNYDKLKQVNLEGIVWWDEVNKECFIGDFREGSST